MWFLYMTVHSYGYAIFFAVNHWVDEVTFSDNSSVSQTNWGELQVISSVNFDLGDSLWSKFIFHITGGLNYQIEHHLFPSYTHTLLPEISKIIREEAKKRNL